MATKRPASSGKPVIAQSRALQNRLYALKVSVSRSIAALHTYTNEGDRDMGLSECQYLRAHLNDQFATLQSMTATLLHTVRNQNDARHETESKLRKLEAEVSCLKEDDLSFTQILDQVQDADTACAADMDDDTVPAKDSKEPVENWNLKIKWYMNMLLEEVCCYSIANISQRTREAIKTPSLRHNDVATLLLRHVSVGYNSLSSWSSTT